MSYPALMKAAKDHLDMGDHIIQQGSESWRDDFYSNRKEFWKHYGIVTGETVDDVDSSPFCCSC